MKRTLIVFIAAIVITSVVMSGFVAYDTFQDRQHRVFTEESVPAYPAWEQYPSQEMRPIFVLSAKTHAKVKRIRYGKDYMAVQVQNEKGELGWIFYGPGFRIKKAT